MAGESNRKKQSPGKGYFPDLDLLAIWWLCSGINLLDRFQGMHCVWGRPDECSVHA